MRVGHHADVKATLALTRQRHVQRVAGALRGPRLDEHADPELRSAWRSLQLEWLDAVPGYRALVSQRVSEALHEHDVEQALSADHFKEPGFGRCVECGGDLSPTRFTDGCAHCGDRQRKAQRRRSARDVDRIGREVEACG